MCSRRSSAFVAGPSAPADPQVDGAFRGAGSPSLACRKPLHPQHLNVGPANHGSFLFEMLPHEVEVNDLEAVEPVGDAVRLP